MITDRFIHIGIGDTGQGVLRDLLLKHAVRKYGLNLINDNGHLRVVDILPKPTKRRGQNEIVPSMQDDQYPPVFAFVRNPYSWYISRWMHALRNRKYRGTFSDHVLIKASTSDADAKPGIDGKYAESFWETYLWHTNDEILPEYVGMFENYVDDTVRILVSILPEWLDEKGVRGLFPAAFTQWRNYNWMEDIEVCMCRELYTKKLREYVEREDAELIERHGYKFPK